MVGEGLENFLMPTTDRPAFPTMEQVEKAVHERLARWCRFLASGDTKEQQKIMDRIEQRFKKMGGITKEISDKKRILEHRAIDALLRLRRVLDSRVFLSCLQRFMAEPRLDVGVFRTLLDWSRPIKSRVSSTKRDLCFSA